MFIRKTQRTYKDKTYTNYLLVRSVHTRKGPRQKVIRSLGDLRPHPAEEWLKLPHRVEDALVGRQRLSDQPDEEVEKIVRQVRQRQKQKSGEPPTGGEEESGERPTGGQQAAGKDDLVAVHTDRVGMECPREGGPVHVG